MSLAAILLASVVIVLGAYGGGLALAHRRHRDPAATMALGLTAYWTLIGSIPVLLAKMRNQARPYTYLEDRLFPIVVDRDYLSVILFYGLFLVGVLLVVSVCSKPSTRPHQNWSQWALVAGRFSHGLAITGLAIGTVLRLVVVRRLLGVEGGSLYGATRVARGSAASWVRLYQYLNLTTAYTLACAITLWIAIPSARRGGPAFRRLVTAGYLILGLAVLAENALLGNRAVPLVMGGAVACGWLRWRFGPATRTERARLRRRAVLTLIVGILAVGSIGISRGGNLATPRAVLTSLSDNLSRPGNVVLQELRSSEKVAAHMSLYGVIREEPFERVPLTAGSYGAYARLVGAPDDQVFTVHFVTGWWLWLGPAGLLLATVTFGLGVALLQRLAAGWPTAWTAGFRLAAATLPGVGFAVTVTRSGPESLRAAMIELVLIPAMALTACFLLGRNRTRRTAPLVAASSSVMVRLSDEPAIYRERQPCTNDRP